MNYLVRLNMVLNPGSTKKCSTLLVIYFGILIVELIGVNTVQYLVLDGDCHDIGNYGCRTSFSEWNGWMTSGILLHDMVIYYLFCVYYIRRVEAKINPQRAAARNSIKVGVAAQSVETSDQFSVGSGNVPSAASGSNRMDSKMSVNSNSGGGSTSIEASRAKKRKELVERRERRKLTLVYHGLLRQFRVTLIAIGICGVDLLCNTFWMDYNMLWLNMLDACAVVALNLLAFRDSQYLVMNVFEWCKQFGCESCSLLIDVCCCMKDSSAFGSGEESATTAATGDTNLGVDDSDSEDTPYEDEDSFLRYSGDNTGLPDDQLEITALTKIHQ